MKIYESWQRKDKGGIVVRILHHVGQVHDGCIFVAMRLFGEKAAWVHKAPDTEELNLFHMTHTGELKLYARACSVKISAERYPQISCVCA